MKCSWIKQSILRRDTISESIITCIVFMISVIILIIPINSNILGSIINSIIMIPLAMILGKSTSKISDYIGEKRGGLIAATAGNIPELMMGFWSIKYGMVAMAKAGLLGAVITNMLLALGIAVFLGGIKYKEQIFNKVLARTNFNLLFLVMVTVVIIAALNRYSIGDISKISTLNNVVSLILIGVYILGLIFSLYTHSNLFLNEKEEIKNHNNKEIRNLFVLILIVTILLYFISENLISNIKLITIKYNLSEEFVGIILIPLLGSFGENASAIMCAINNQIDASLETAIGSSIQISMFVLPVLVIWSSFIGVEINLLFSVFQIIMLAIAIAMSYMVFQDGRTYWLEGGILIATYALITIAYYYIN